jgi:L-threonylcarbamoyladenylate synthase
MKTCNGDDQVERAARALRSGGLVAFPTETVYGLGADATSAPAVGRVFAAKGRPATNPLIVHVADEAVARRYSRRWPEAARRLAERFWPGPLTLVLPRSDAIVKEATAGLDTVGLRAPDHPLALALLRAFDGPVAAPSANRSTRISPTTAEHVRQELGDRVDMILDGGPCRVGIESTVLDLSGDVPAILRPGGVTREQIEAVLGASVRQNEFVTEAVTPAMSPGQHEVHYAPHAPAYRFEASQRGQVLADDTGVMALGPLRADRKGGMIVAMPNDPADYARRFYATLREIDETRPRAIYIEMPPDEPRWSALRDRIRRATRPIDDNSDATPEPRV